MCMTCYTALFKTNGTVRNLRQISIFVHAAPKLQQGEGPLYLLLAGLYQLHHHVYFWVWIASRIWPFLREAFLSLSVFFFVPLSLYFFISLSVFFQSLSLSLSISPFHFLCQFDRRKHFDPLHFCTQQWLKNSWWIVACICVIDCHNLRRSKQTDGRQNDIILNMKVESSMKTGSIDRIAAMVLALLGALTEGVSP